MRTLDRRTVLAGLAAIATLDAAHADGPEDLDVDTTEGRMPLTRYAAGLSGRRSCVLVLHGNRTIELGRRAYERHARALTAKGIDTYFVRYFTAADSRALDPGTTTKESRSAYNTTRFDGWARRVSSAMTAILARSDSSGRIGLLGFSLGGYVAAGTAAYDERVTALAVLYGGMPDELISRARHLPPLIDLHGDADKVVPLEKGEELVRLGKALGAKAELVTYPGRGHGFDFSDTDPMAADAIERVTRFFELQLRSS